MANGVNRYPVTVHLLDLVPRKGGGVADRLEARLGVAVGDDVEPVAVAAVFGDPLLVRREADGPRACHASHPLSAAMPAGQPSARSTGRNHATAFSSHQQER